MLNVRHAAFTLIEMLVVVSIITVLVTMLLVAIKLVRQQAMSIDCTSQLRQLGMAVEGYAQDNEGMLVNYSTPVSGLFWWSLLIPYADKEGGKDSGGVDNNTLVKTRSIFRCKSTIPEAAQVTWGIGMKAWHNISQSQTVNLDNSTQQLSLNQVWRPGQRILAGDSVARNLWAGGICPFFPNGTLYHLGPHDGRDCLSELRVFNSPGGSGVPRRHGSTSNWLHYDGHVAKLDNAESAPAIR